MYLWGHSTEQFTFGMNEGFRPFSRSMLSYSCKRVSLWMTETFASTWKAICCHLADALIIISTLVSGAGKEGRGWSLCNPLSCSSSPQVLYVPRHWWHYVESVDPITVSINSWIEMVNSVSLKKKNGFNFVLFCFFNFALNFTSDEGLAPLWVMNRPCCERFPVIMMSVFKQHERVHCMQEKQVLLQPGRGLF